MTAWKNNVKRPESWILILSLSCSESLGLSFLSVVLLLVKLRNGAERSLQCLHAKAYICKVLFKCAFEVWFHVLRNKLHF